MKYVTRFIAVYAVSAVSVLAVAARFLALAQDPGWPRQIAGGGGFGGRR